MGTPLAPGSTQKQGPLLSSPRIQGGEPGGMRCGLPWCQDLPRAVYKHISPPSGLCLHTWPPSWGAELCRTPFTWMHPQPGGAGRNVRPVAGSEGAESQGDTGPSFSTLMTSQSPRLARRCWAPSSATSGPAGGTVLSVTAVQGGCSWSP